MERDISIVGIGESTYYKRGGAPVSEFELLLHAIEAAAADAGLVTQSIDGFFSYSMERWEPGVLMRALGIETLRASVLAWSGEGGGVYATFQHAAAALRSGDCDVAVVYRSLAQGQYSRYGALAPWAYPSFNLPFGAMSPVHVLTLMVSRYMSRYDVPSEALGHVAVQSRVHAQRNPRAVMYGKPLTLEQHQASRMIADPHRLFDCCLENDGAAAILLTRSDRAQDTRHPVAMVAAAQGGEARWEQGAFGYHNMPADTYSTGNSRTIAARVFQRAGVSAADIGSVQMFTAFSGLALMGLEDCGFAEPGGAADLVMSGATRWPQGRIPMSTSGGAQSEAYIHGLNMVNEAVRQVRGESTAQVPESNFSLVAAPAGANPTSMMLVGR